MIGEGVGWGIALRTGLCGVRDVSTPVGSSGLCPEGLASPVPRLQMLSFMHAQYSFFQQGYSLLHQLDPYMKKLAAEVSAGGSGGVGGPDRSCWGSVFTSHPDAPPPQLDQLVIDSAVEKRDMERKHAAIQQRVRPCSP